MIDILFDIATLFRRRVSPCHISEHGGRLGKRFKSKMPCQAKIDQPKIFARIQNDVLWLDVAMDYISGFCGQERLQNMKAESQIAFFGQGTIDEQFVYRCAGNAALAKPKAISDGCRNRSVVVDFRDSRRLHLGRCEQFPHRPLKVLTRANQLQNNVAVVDMPRFEDLLLPSLRKRANSGEIGEVLLKPGSGKLHLLIQNYDPDSVEAPRQTHSLNNHDA